MGWTNTASVSLSGEKSSTVQSVSSSDVCIHFEEVSDKQRDDAVSSSMSADSLLADGGSDFESLGIGVTGLHLSLNFGIVSREGAVLC